VSPPLAAEWRWVAIMDTPSNIDRLCAERGIDARQLAELSGVDEQRVMAIVLGRWTPSPQERDRIAAVFGLTRDQIAWGHVTPIQHIYGHGPG
jgi:transcriptional regulator with XRE-family HTH domain